MCSKTYIQELDGVEWLQFATFKKDTTLERQGEFTLSTLQGGARAGERLNEPNDKPQETPSEHDKTRTQQLVIIG